MTNGDNNKKKTIKKIIIKKDLIDKLEDQYDIIRDCIDRKAHIRHEKKTVIDL